ncbi:MAG: TonB-dependent receptor domain-containing protein [Balneolaceae bacterium]
MLKIKILTVLLWISAAALADAQNGRIAGTVVDQRNGDPLVGATIFVEELERGVSADIDGSFIIDRIPIGSYTVIVRFVSYSTQRIENVEVSANQTFRMDVSMQTESVDLGEVVVSARALQNNESSLLAQRQKAISISNAVSAEFMSKSGSSNAADAMEKVTGATVLDGKYVYVRGLGDRYMNTQLNGATIPSSNPDRNAVSFDLFPSSLLDNITTTKSFTPDLPGNFTGGSINIRTKDFPDRFEFSISTSSGYNSAVGARGSVLHYNGGRTGFFGVDRSNFAIPEAIRNAETIPSFGVALTNKEEAERLDQLTKSFSSTMAPRRIKAPFDNSFSASTGTRFNLSGTQIGVVAAFSQSRDFNGYDKGTSSRFQLTSNAATTDELNSEFTLNDSFGSEEVLYGGLLNLSVKPHPFHEIGFNLMLNRNIESSARRLAGSFPRDLPADGLFETRVLRYTERSLDSYQFRGDHQFGQRLGVRFEWDVTLADTEQDEPDIRFFTNDVLIRERGGGEVDTTFQISPSIYPRPTRFFRNLQEDNNTVNAAVTIPFDHLTGSRARLKVGGSYGDKSREFNEREFQFAQDNFRFTGDEEAFFAQENLGIDEERSGAVITRFRNYLIDNTQIRNSYTGDQTVEALFAMVDMILFNRLRVSGGARLEQTKINVASADTTIQAGRIDENDWLPSISLTYEISQRMNARFTYGKTLARPTFREMAPFAAFDFVNSNTVIGNPELERTLIDNFDLRWEWFTRPGELVAVSFFYKDFDRPIEKVFNPLAAGSNPEIQFRNVDNAEVYGIEIELRKQLDQLSNTLRHFDVGFNATFAQSEVSIGEDELELIRALDADASGTREMQGQSPFVINADMTYSNINTGTTLSAFYNVFGRRMTEVSTGGTPNIFEYSRNQLDFIAEQEFIRNLKVRFSVKNVLDEDFRKGHEFKGRDFFTQVNERGRSFSIGVSYSF